MFLHQGFFWPLYYSFYICLWQLLPVRQTGILRANQPLVLPRCPGKMYCCTRYKQSVHDDRGDVPRRNHPYKAHI